MEISIGRQRSSKWLNRKLDLNIEYQAAIQVHSTRLLRWFVGDSKAQLKRNLHERKSRSGRAEILVRAEAAV